MEITDSIKWHVVKKLPCKECWSYELKWFIKLHKWYCNHCSKEHKDIVNSNYLWNKWHITDTVTDTCIPTVEKVVSQITDTVTVSLNNANKSTDTSTVTTVTDTVTVTQEFIMWQYNISDRTFYRWLTKGKIKELTKWHYIIVDVTINDTN